MKKLIGLLIAIVASISVIGFVACDPIDDAKGERQLLVLAGKEGPMGPQGPQGPQGIQGPAGESCTIEAVTDCPQYLADSISTGPECRTGVKITCGGISYYIWNGVDGQDGLNGSNGADGADGVSCTAAKVEGGVAITCGENTFTVWDGQDGEDGEDGTCIDCCPQITILVPPCSTQFVVIKITMGTVVKYVTTEPVYKWMGGCNCAHGGYLGDLVTSLVVGQKYKYWSSSDICLFEIKADGSGLLEWEFCR
ncbi:MAG TPA: hypothetical protein P5136_06370 [Methanofastidiosum sp.]|nr:hypothetical protein [Methanofastidiosum sp.]